MPDKLVMTKHIGEPPNEVPVHIYERTQMVYAGSTMIPAVVECFFVLPAPNWPRVRIQARRGLTKWLFRRGIGKGKHAGIMLDDDLFNNVFKVTSKDEEFAIMLLSPELQAFLLTKANIDWSTGDSTIKLWYRGKIRKSRINASLERIAHFQSLIANELFDWE